MFFKKMKTEEPDTEDQVADKIVTLMDKAEKCVWISSGFNPEFYNRPKVKKAIERAFSKVNNVRILVHGKPEEFKEDVKWLFDFAQTNKDKIELRSRPANDNLSHWVIVDQKHFRLEKKHVERTVGDRNLFVTDMDTAVVDLLIPRFYDWWKDAEKIKQ